MYKIPDPTTKQYSQKNLSDISGNIFSTKNMNFDEEGYAKLSSRAVRIYSEADGGAFDIPTSFGRFGQGIFHVITADRAFDTNITRNSTALASQDLDTGTPSLDFDSTGCWFQNRWHTVTDDGSLVYKSGSTWTDTGLNFTVGITHALEVFRNKNAIAISDGNVVKLYDTSYSLLFTLTIPIDFEIVGLSYSKSNMAIITILSSTLSGQNQEAYFFQWNGATNEAGIGIPCGSDGIMSITPYGYSWAIITRAGQLLQWNGGGFNELGVLPFFSEEYQWSGSSSKSMYGNSMQVDGDKIYINISSQLNQFGTKDERYIPNYPGGILCYDPKVGIYHRYSPSVSIARMARVPDSGINTTTNTFTKNLGTLPVTGNPILYTYNRSTQIGGLKVGTIYYIINLDGTNFRLALTKADAIAGNAIDITSIGDSTNYFVTLDIVDYGQSLSSRTAGVALLGATDIMFDKLIFGGDYNDVSSASTDYATLCLTIPGFKNIGWFTTVKLPASEVEDNIKDILIKCRKLGIDDTIQVKYMNDEVFGVPVTTPQKNGIRCQWTSNKVFTTTADLSEVLSYLDEDDQNECECEIISGAAAGQLSQIASITFLTDTYTVTLQDELDGATASSYCDISIENWKHLKTYDDKDSMDSTDTNNYSHFPIEKASKWTRFKVIFTGSDIAFEEATIDNGVQIGDGV